ncbi:MAG: hypothetical protein IAE94_09780 [Chthoniobacterales bacterium]|nr:hypothetical protein [Chthoniobacterales bacterium]
MNNFPPDPAGVRFLEPLSGSVLNHRQGRVVPEGLIVPVSLEWPTAGGRSVWIDGNPATVQGGVFQAHALVSADEQEICATADSPEGPILAKVRVVYDRFSRCRYRITIDDNIFCLEEIARTLPRSIFDCFYLHGLRDLHQRYGTKFALNVFFSTPNGDFTLAQFPERYRAEFADNGHWLTWAFHAKSEFPDRPYANCTPEQIAADYDQVASEILRFAGEAAYSPTTVVHWAMVHPGAWKALYDRDTRILSGFFVPAAAGHYVEDGVPLSPSEKGANYDINYGMDSERSAILSGCDLLKDFDSGLVFSKFDMVLNNTLPEQITPILESLKHRPQTAEIMDLMTHEQYFWPHYHACRPDHFLRCEIAIRWCVENGYDSVFFHQGLAGVGRGL